MYNITNNDFLVELANRKDKYCKIAAINKITDINSLKQINLPSEFEDRTYNGDGPVVHPVNDAYEKRLSQLN